MTSSKRSKATLKALRREGRTATSSEALSRHALNAMKERGPTKRHEAAMRAVRTKGHEEMSRAAKGGTYSKQRAA